MQLVNISSTMNVYNNYIQTEKQAYMNFVDNQQAGNMQILKTRDCMAGVCHIMRDLFPRVFHSLKILEE